MPLYEYNCEQCGPFTELRRVSECDMPAECPECNTSASRMISVPRLAIMEKNNRTAWERNEKSAHEPRKVKAGHRHEHSHEHKGKHNHQHQHSHKHAHSGRPWMLGH
jgi:putative FmdB family regulatory protein